MADGWFLEALRRYTSSGGVVVNVTQCQAGSVDMGAYANGAILRDAGVTGGYDITTESALTKLFCILGKYVDPQDVRNAFLENQRGEISNK